MGLDMYAYARTNAPESDVDFASLESDREFHYWRKHPNLHGWMERLYRSKGGTDTTFNCVNLRLTSDDLTELERAIKSRELPTTGGFFFGASDGTETNDDLAFIHKARLEIEGGNTVYYSSWW